MSTAQAIELIAKQFNLLVEQVEILNHRITLLEREKRFSKKFDTACQVCGLGSQGPMGYACPRQDCPTAITYHINQQDLFR